MRNEQRLSEEIRIWPAALRNTEPLHYLEHDSAQNSETCSSQGLKHRKAKRKILILQNPAVLVTCPSIPETRNVVGSLYLLCTKVTGQVQ